MLNKREGPTHSIVVLPNIFWHVGVDEFGLLINMNLTLMNIMWRHTYFSHGAIILDWSKPPIFQLMGCLFLSVAPD
jgi:hypothetical protein